MAGFSRQAACKLDQGPGVAPALRCPAFLKFVVAVTCKEKGSHPVIRQFACKKPKISRNALITERLATVNKRELPLSERDNCGSRSQMISRCRKFGSRVRSG